MDLNTFKKKYTNRNAALGMFMRISALSWLEYVQKVSNGKFKPDVDRIMKFSDAEEDYNFDYEKKHTSINPNVTVGELLCVANKLMSYQPDVDFWEIEDWDDSEPAKPELNPMQADGLYIVNCLMVYPFTILEDQA